MLSSLLIHHPEAVSSILAIYFTKYGVGIELAMQPALAQSLPFAFGLAAV